MLVIPTDRLISPTKSVTDLFANHITHRWIQMENICGNLTYALTINMIFAILSTSWNQHSWTLQLFSCCVLCSAAAFWCCGVFFDDQIFAEKKRESWEQRRFTFVIIKEFSSLATEEPWRILECVGSKNSYSHCEKFNQNLVHFDVESFSKCNLFSSQVIHLSSHDRESPST